MRNDDDWLADFGAGRLPSLPHVDHVRAAYLCLRDFALPSAIERFVVGLRATACALGAPEKFNESLTRACLALVAVRFTMRPQPDWPAFATANPDLLTWTTMRTLLPPSHS